MTSLNDPQFMAFLAAEKQQESGGNPYAVSPDGALGYYQVLPGNIVSFARMALGPTAWVTPEQFLQNPQLQESIVSRVLLQYVNQYGYAGAAAKWYSGDANKVNDTTPQGNGPSISQYVQDVMAAMGGNPSTGQSTDNSGISLDHSSVAPYVPAATPIFSLDSLRQQSPLVAALIGSVPELTNLFNQAVTGQWSTDKFISAVQNSNWWRTTSDTARQAFAQMKADPAAWNQSVSNLEVKLRDYAVQLGAQVSVQELYSVAVDALMHGYDSNDAMLRQKFEQFVVPVSGLHYGGQAGVDETQIRQYQQDLGVFLPEKQLDSNIQQIAGGTSSVQNVAAQLRTQAAALYPAYAQQINQGMNVSDIAAPYLSQAKNLLENGPGEFNLQSPLIKQALQYSVDGKPTIMPLGDFENLVRADPRWRGTDNAQNSIMTTAHQVLQNFGLAY